MLRRNGMQVATAGWVLALSIAVFADDVRPPAPAVPSGVSRLEGVQLEQDDEPLTIFEPRVPVAPEMQQKKSALTWHMLGILHQGREEDKAAIAAFQKAIAADPTTIDSYQAAIPLLLKTRKESEARTLAIESALHSTQGFELVQTMAALYARDNKVAEAAELLGQAAELPTLQPGSVQALELHRDRGLYQRLGEDFAAAADEYAIVFEVLTAGSLAKEDWERVVRDAGATFDEFGDTFLKAERPELALKAYEEASKYRETKPGMHSYNLATVLQKTQQPEKALEELDRYLAAQLQTRGRQAYQLLKDLLHDLKRDDELFPRLEQLHTDDPHNETLTYFLADQLVLADKLDEAERIYLGKEQVENINDPRALVGMMSIYRRRSDEEKLLPLLTKLFQLVPRDEGGGGLANLADDIRALAEHFEAELTGLKDDEAAMSALYDYARTKAEGTEPQLDFVQAYILGKLAIEADRSDDAVEFYQLAISMRNDPPELLYWELGSHLVDADQYETAIVVLNQAIEHPATSLQAAHWKFQFLLSYAYEYLGRTDEALEVIQQAQQGQPDLPLLFYQEGWVVYHRQRWDEALEIFEKVIEEFPAEQKMVLDCQFLMSNIYVKQGDMPRGEQVLLDILEDHPDHPQANNDLGYLWADQNKNLEQAKTMITKALAAEPDNVAYQDSMGWILYREGDYAGSYSYLKKATEDKKGEDSTLFEHYGDCLIKLDRSEEARQVFEKALELEMKKELQDGELVQRLKQKLGM